MHAKLLCKRNIFVTALMNINIGVQIARAGDLRRRSGRLHHHKGIAAQGWQVTANRKQTKPIPSWWQQNSDIHGVVTLLLILLLLLLQLLVLILLLLLLLLSLLVIDYNYDYYYYYHSFVIIIIIASIVMILKGLVTNRSAGFSRWINYLTTYGRIEPRTLRPS